MFQSEIILWPHGWNDRHIICYVTLSPNISKAFDARLTAQNGVRAVPKTWSLISIPKEARDKVLTYIS